MEMIRGVAQGPAMIRKDFTPGGPDAVFFHK
jgi:hypothetical protein